MMRGYTWSNRNSGFAAIRRLKNGLIAEPVAATKAGAKWFYGASAPNAELVVRQFINDRYGGERLNSALFEHLGCKDPITAGMPSTWRSHLIDSGWPVNRLASLLGWSTIVGLRFGHGVLYLIKLCAKLALTKKRITVSEPYAYFEGLKFANLPLQSNDGTSYDICSFYSQWPGRSPRVLEIRHDVAGANECVVNRLRVGYLPPPYCMSGGFCVALKLSWWGGWAIILAAIQMLLGRWHWALMLGEATKAKAVQIASRENLAAEYWFHASGNIYRPMWTYEAEDKGSKVFIYFYSISVQPKLKTGYESQQFEWGANTWPYMIVWDEYQEKRLRNYLGKKVEIVQAGPVNFSDSSAELPPLPPSSIAVFDIQPYRYSMYRGVSTLADCMADYPNFYHLFLSDVTEVLEECGALAVLKRKREIGARGDKRYNHILKRLESRRSACCMVDPALSVVRVAARCCASISAPFTSTALHVRALGKPSVYYDPVGWMQADDSGAHGIPVLCGKKALRDWVNDVLRVDVK
jgi:polysaccharide biosynthesis PFTS motif protein